MDLAINGVYIPDFKKLSFVRLNIGINNGKISCLSEVYIKGCKNEINAPGFIASLGLVDCHCHIESSLLKPSFFGALIAKMGTLYAVADCHEITNVAGLKGLLYFMEDIKETAINIKFAVPSCVPASVYASGGGQLTTKEILYLLAMDNVVSLGEVMDIEKVLKGDKDLLYLINKAKMSGKRVNGHAPELKGANLKRYFDSGIEDDHENEKRNEIEEKLKLGVKIFLREGTASRTDDAAYKLIEKYSDDIMFCTDDITAGDILKKGHINYHLRKAVANGINPVLAIKVASYNGLKYYNLSDIYEIKEGADANVVIFDNEKNFNIYKVILAGREYQPAYKKTEIPSYIRGSFDVKSSLIPAITERARKYCINVKDGSLMTEIIDARLTEGEYSIHEDILKIVNINRYGAGYSSAARIHGFSLKYGALASSIAHDCHNVIAVGTDDISLQKVINIIITEGGGLSCFDGKDLYFLPLPVGGIVSDQDPVTLVKEYEELRKKAKELGCTLTDPFSTLSFMALEVIPHIKLTDRGLFDVDNFKYI